MTQRPEIIVVRSLADSDLGLFAAHRRAERSRQRAININAPVAKRLISERLFALGGGPLPCQMRFGKAEVTEVRPLSKTGKNWRLGGNKVADDAFASLDSKDFMLIRSVAENDGLEPIGISFISRNESAVVHAGLVAKLADQLTGSMAVFEEGTREFSELAVHCPKADEQVRQRGQFPLSMKRPKAPNAGDARFQSIPPMPPEPSEGVQRGPRSVKDKIRSPILMERMLQVAGDLSGPAQLRFMETVEALATQLRILLLESDRIINLRRDHAALWGRVAGEQIGFVDGGLANLSMLGSAPVAARVGGYVVTPGDRSPERESFTVLKYLIDELYAQESGVYDESFPDVSALRDAARISIEAAGAVHLAEEQKGLKWLMLHGALVNPVSRYTDQRQEGRLRHRFPAFSTAALQDLLPSEKIGDDHASRVFVSVYRRQLELLQETDAVVCGVVERESTTSTVALTLIRDIPDDVIEDVVGRDAEDWRRWFRQALNPADDSESEGQRISDSLLFRCVLEPGEILRPVPVDRNDERRAPKDWWDVIKHYPQPYVSYLQPTEWNSPVRIEIFEKDLERFVEAAELIFHCALLLPKYAFPVGLHIVDQFAKIPDWMSRPVNTFTTVTALRRALDSGQMELFDSLRRMLCGSSREWLLRPVMGR